VFPAELPSIEYPGLHTSITISPKTTFSDEPSIGADVNVSLGLPHDTGKHSCSPEMLPVAKQVAKKFRFPSTAPVTLYPLLHVASI
jgi:hypothetical protein